MSRRVLHRWGRLEQVCLTVYCIPHAGAGAAAIEPLAQEARADEDLVGVRLSGRENRFSEGQPRDLESVVTEITEAVRDDATSGGNGNIPRVILGQCSGAIVAAHVAKRLGPLVSGLVVVSPPDKGSADTSVTTTSLLSLGGFDEDLLLSDEMRAMIEEIIEGDVKLTTQSSIPVDLDGIPVLEIRGRFDDTEQSEQPWKEVSTSTRQLEFVDSGHFVVRDAPGTILSLIRCFLK